MSSSDEEADEPDFSTVIEDIDFETIENIHSGKVVIYINRLISDQKMIWSILRRLKTNHLTQLKMKTIKKFMISLKSVKLIITTSKLVWNLISRFRKSLYKSNQSNLHTDNTTNLF